MSLLSSRHTSVPLRSSDVAFFALREKIVNLSLAPGSLINEQEMAKELGLGRMPVRESIARLAQEKFVTIVPRRGAIVEPINLETSLVMFETREVIECGVTRIAALRLEEHQLQELRELTEAANHDRHETDYENFLAHDLAFHRYLGEAMRDPNLRELSERLLMLNLRLWRSIWSTRSSRPHSMVSHREILTALEKHDPDAAEAAMRHHLEDAREFFRRLLWEEGPNVRQAT